MVARLQHTAIIFFLLLVGVFPAFAQMTDAATSHLVTPDSGLKTLTMLLLAIEHHPIVMSKSADVEASRRRIAASSSLPNPMLMLGVENLPTSSFRFADDPMTSKMIGVTQAFPFPGKLSKQSEIASADTLTSGSEMNEEINTLRRNVTLAYFDVYALDKAVETNKHHLQALKELIPVAEAKLTTGQTSQSEVLNLELEGSDMKSQIIDDETMLESRKTDLEQASGVLADSLPIPPSLGMPLFNYSVEQLDSLARCYRPSLAGIRAKIAQTGLQFDRADMNKYPDFELSLQYMQKDPLLAQGASIRQSDMVSAGISIELPINYNDQRGEAMGEAEALRTMQQSAYQAAILEIHTSLQANVVKLKGLRDQYALLRSEVYPEVNAALETSKTNYEYNKVSLEQVVRSELTLLHREDQRYQLEADYNKTIATIEFLTGTKLVHFTSRSDWK